ncbi:jg13429 [Pararge aegeria aegeria]|uniref:Jg13429 protein n=1 Tax=Pararge aegeria aegeria TaxID=348720 RepID=A0A8S4RYS2_9NEOP|nr:jg13429 [Pararge aegeria aegeria]
MLRFWSETCVEGALPGICLIAPFVLLPSPFPQTEFNKAVELQPILNELMHKVAHDDEFLTRTLQNALQVDEFTASLFDIWVKVRDEGMAQTLSLGLFRSDYLMQNPDGNRIKQVEFNTVASSFGALTSYLHDMTRYPTIARDVSMTLLISIHFFYVLCQYIALNLTSTLLLSQ